MVSMVRCAVVATAETRHAKVFQRLDLVVQKHGGEGCATGALRHVGTRVVRGHGLFCAGPQDVVIPSELGTLRQDSFQHDEPPAPHP